MGWEGYPIRLSPVYRDKIWGGNQIRGIRKGALSSRIGESWDIACRTDCDSMVENGIYAGHAFEEIVALYKKELLGEVWKEEPFPLLIKLIGTKEALSVQVHPDDTYAGHIENGIGKTEMWYVLRAEPGAYLIAGTKECTKEQLRQAVLENRAQEYMNQIPVRKGDYLLLPSGMVHALGPGCLIVEIQQNSDITYRIWDYGRPRELHIDRAMDVVDVTLKPEVNSDKNIKAVNSRVSICETNYFCIDYVNVSNAFELLFDEPCFHTVTCISGEGKVANDTGYEKFAIGDSLFLPPDLKGYRVEGSCSLLLTTPIKSRERRGRK